jgi:hypothetical protein
MAPGPGPASAVTAALRVWLGAASTTKRPPQYPVPGPKHVTASRGRCNPPRRLAEQSRSVRCARRPQAGRARPALPARIRAGARPPLPHRHRSRRNLPARCPDGCSVASGRGPCLRAADTPRPPVQRLVQQICPDLPPPIPTRAPAPVGALGDRHLGPQQQQRPPTPVGRSHHLPAHLRNSREQPLPAPAD